MLSPTGSGTQPVLSAPSLLPGMRLLTRDSMSRDFSACASFSIFSISSIFPASIPLVLQEEHGRHLGMDSSVLPRTKCHLANSTQDRSAQALGCYAVLVLLPACTRGCLSTTSCRMRWQSPPVLGRGEDRAWHIPPDAPRTNPGELMLGEAVGERGMKDGAMEVWQQTAHGRRLPCSTRAPPSTASTPANPSQPLCGDGACISGQQQAGKGVLARQAAKKTSGKGSRLSWTQSLHPSGCSAWG